MRDLLLQELSGQSHPGLKKLVLTEFLQHLILQSLSRHGVFDKIAFTGGTALRILHRANRFSEDLEFSLAGRGIEQFDFVLAVERVKKDLVLQQFNFDFSTKDEKTVVQANLRFAGLMKEFGLSPLKDQKLMIRVELDTHPPAGGVRETALVTAPLSYAVTVFDLPSLFATKLHAVLHRPYAKGRDFYDLMWYLGRNTRPNLKLLNNAIRQTQGDRHEVTEANFKDVLSQRLEAVDFIGIRREVERFLIKSEELTFLDSKHLKILLRNY